MEENPTFSYLRLGDGELRFMLMIAEKTWSDTQARPEQRASIEYCFGTPGLEARDYPRLRRAYENCSWLDRYESVPYNREHLPGLHLIPSSPSQIHSEPGTDQLFHDWTCHELGGYLTRHRCLFCGSEAALLEALTRKPEYREIAARFWPQSDTFHFLQPRHNGAHLSEDLDTIKQDIAGLIDQHQIDTLFLSLGGAAKIIGYELSVEKNVRIFDFGSMMRALAYSGSDGQSFSRSTHHPFLVRVPFALYMHCLRQAHPDSSPAQLIAKAHAQLCLELLHKVPLQSHTCDLNDYSSYDPSRENLQHFYQSYADYRQHYYPWAKQHPEVRPLLKEFRTWRLHKGLGLDGRLYQAARVLARFFIPRKR